MPGKEVQQVELARRQVQPAAVDLGRAGHRVDGHAVQGQAAGVDPRIAFQRLAAAQKRPHPRHQLQHGERLGQIVVRAQLQPQDAVHLAGSRAGDDDGRIARHGACALADLKAVDARQHQVQHQRVPAAFLQPPHAFVAVRGMLDGIAFVPQVQTQQFRDVGVVFDDEYASWRVHGRETL